MTVRLYIDEDAMDTDFVRALRTRGVDLLTANEAGMVAEPDEHHLRYAAAHGRALLSYNIADYHRIHAVFQANGEPHAGIILVEQTRFSLGEQLRRVLKLVSTRSAAEMQNRMEFLAAWG